MARKGENIFKRKDGRWEGRVVVGYADNGNPRTKSVLAKTLADKDNVEVIFGDAMKLDLKAIIRLFKQNKKVQNGLYSLKSLYFFNSSKL